MNSQGSSEATLNIFEYEEAVIPGNLCTGFINEKDSLEKISRCTTSNSLYHRTSLSLF